MTHDDFQRIQAPLGIGRGEVFGPPLIDPDARTLHPRADDISALAALAGRIGMGMVGAALLFLTVWAMWS